MQKMIDDATGEVAYRLLTPEQYVAGIAYARNNAIPCEYGVRSTDARKPKPWGSYIILFGPTPTNVTGFEAAIA
jgi:hypothetical protein